MSRGLTLTFKIMFIKQAPTHMQILPIQILMNTQIHLISSVTYD